MHRRALLAATLAAPALAQRPAPLPVPQDDSVAAGWRRDVLLRGGDQVTPDAPRFDPAALTPEAAGGQIGWDGRLACLVHPPAATDGVPRGILVMVHPTVPPAMVFPDGRDRPEVSGRLQGATLLNIQKQAGRWVVVTGGFQSRRLTADTLCRLTGAEDGPARGVLGVGAGAPTPWGTLLLAEGDPAPWLPRLGRPANEARQHGRIVEVDPFDPISVPAKRTRLGQGGFAAVAAARTADGRAVVYAAETGASARLVRFVSAGQAGPDALDEGALAFATDQGGGLRWAEGGEAALRFDRPVVMTVCPRTNRVLLGCAGAGPRPQTGSVLGASAQGHVVALDPPGGDHGAERFAASVVLRSADPGLPDGPPGALACAADGATVWLGTDREGTDHFSADALFALRAGGAFSPPQRIYTAPRGAGIGGVAQLPDGALAVAVRRPGFGPQSAWTRPATRWPTLNPGDQPRSTVVVLER